MRYLWLAVGLLGCADEIGNIEVYVWPNGSSQQLDLGVVGWDDGPVAADFSVANGDVVSLALWKVCLPGSLALDEALLDADLNEDGDTVDQLSDCESDPLVAKFITPERYDIDEGIPLREAAYTDPDTGKEYPASQPFRAIEGSSRLYYSGAPVTFVPGESIAVTVGLAASNSGWIPGEYEDIRLRMGFEAYYLPPASDGSVDFKGFRRAAYDFGVRYELICDLDGDGSSAVACSREAPGWGDCNDRDVRIRPDAPELCNQIDDNCDGQKDEGCR